MNRYIVQFISAIADFTVTRARSEAMTFGHPLTIVYDSLFIKNPAVTLNYFAYMEPLKVASWIFIGLFCLFASTILFVFVVRR